MHASLFVGDVARTDLAVEQHEREGVTLELGEPAAMSS
jgi:hypothetical protein